MDLVTFHGMLGVFQKDLLGYLSDHQSSMVSAKPVKLDRIGVLWVPSIKQCHVVGLREVFLCWSTCPLELSLVKSREMVPFSGYWKCVAGCLHNCHMYLY